VLTNGSVKKDSGWQQYDIEIHGFNDAPVLPKQAGVFATDDPNFIQDLLWTDIDNDSEQQKAGMFKIDVWKEDADGNIKDAGTPVGDKHEQVEGEFGTLVMDKSLGGYKYSTNDDVFNDIVHRVSEEFMVEVRDPGTGEIIIDDQGNSSYKYSEISSASALTVYAVDGERIGGDDGDNTLKNTHTDGRSYILDGRDGNDTILGGQGDNIILGGKGDDTITSGEGSNIIYGGEGSDLFIYNQDSLKNATVTFHETDEIKDFTLDGNKGDHLALGDILGTSGDADMNALLNLAAPTGTWGSDAKQLTVNGHGNYNLEATFKEESITLDIKEGTNIVRSIDVSFEGGYNADLNEAAARAMLMEMIKNNT
jgi:hypothetical protein